MKWLSLFDGCSGGQQAAYNLGLPIETYYASEVDKYAIKSTMANFPNTIQLGDVRYIDTSKLGKIDILIGGSPCQSFSFAGKGNGMTTIDNIEILTLEHYLELKEQNFQFEGQSYLFWEYVRILKEVQPKYFFLENVMMSEKWAKVISKTLGVNPLEINSSLVSAQNRERNYWTNIGMQPMGLFGDMQSIIDKPKDKGILLKDILQQNVDDKYTLSDKMVEYLFRRKEERPEYGNAFKIDKPKASTLRTELGKCGSSDNYVSVREVKQLNGSLESGGKQPYQQNRVYGIDGIAPALCANKSDLLIEQKEDVFCISSKQAHSTLTKNKSSAMVAAMGMGGGHTPMVYSNKIKIRRLTPIECCRLQTIKDDYFFKDGEQIISDTQIYKCCGNGWTIKVIEHIFKYIPNERTI